MEVTMYKCEHCGRLFEDKDAYDTHELAEDKKTKFLKKYPKNDGLDFINGKYCVQRSKVWLDDFKAKLEILVGDITYTPFSYGWYRCLNDSDSVWYPIAMRIINTCPKCYKEWGQGYFANNCECK